MTTEYQALIDRLALPQGKAAAFLGITRRTSNTYARGGPVPIAVIKLLRTAIELGGIDTIDALISKKRRS